MILIRIDFYFYISPCFRQKYSAVQCRGVSYFQLSSRGLEMWSSTFFRF